MRNTIRLGVILVVAAVQYPASRADEPSGKVAPLALTANVKESLDRISADSLRGHLSFLSSDLLEGRGTPSKGLDLAAEYIAAQFRRAGLEPIGGDGFFQTADWKYSAPDPESFVCQWQLDGESISIDADHASGSLDRSLDLRPTSTFKVDARDAKALAALDAAQVKGKVVLAEMPTPYKVDRSQMAEANRARRFYSGWTF